jgi:N-acetylneuraminic acid mutarotase
MQHRSLQVSTFVALAALVAGCSGGGDSPPPTAPAIASLTLVPSVTYADPAPVTVNVSFTFADPNADVAAVTWRMLDGAGAVVAEQVLPLQPRPNIASGQIAGSATAAFAQVGEFTLSLWCEDAGGMRSNELSTVLRVVPQAWRTAAPDPVVREYAAAAALGDRIYVVGGQRTDLLVFPGPATARVDVYDPAADAWTPAPPLSAPRYGVAVAAVGDRLFAFGGREPGSVTSSVVGTVEMFDAATQAWTPRTPMPTPRMHAAAAVVDGRVLVIGGERSPDIVGAVEVYDPATDSWTTAAPLGRPRTMLTAVNWLGRVVAAGGRSANWQQSREVEILDLATNSWDLFPFLPSGRREHAMVLLDGLPAVVGGLGDGELAELLTFDPQAQRWRGRTASPQPFSRAACAVVGSRLCCFRNGRTLVYDYANEIH